jgi:FkbM family methyltransferase
MSGDPRVALAEELRFHRRMLRPGTFVDVGAHIGAFIFEIADGEGVTAVAVEPLPHAFQVLQQRAAKSSKPITLINAALSNTPRESVLTVPVLRGGAPIWDWASIEKDFPLLQQSFPEIVATQSFRVRVVTLDSLNLSHISGMKIDAEGSEYEVLQGGRRVLATMRPVVSVELEERHRTGCTYTVPAFMDALGYACFFEINGEFLPFDRFDRARMQRASPSPIRHEYSDPYVSCFYFVPAEESELLNRMSLPKA